MSTAMPSPLSAARRAHIATVIEVADRGLTAPAAAAHDAIIRASWQRCVHDHRLDPTRMQEAVILPQARLREHQDQMEDFLQIARHGLEQLYRQVAGLGYVVLLTDARGVTVDFLGDLQIEGRLRRAGLYLGADWSEAQAGTCGVGTCISTGQALTVHLDDHFDATHIPLTCTSAPVFGPGGRLEAVLDISQLSSAEPKSSQHLALQLVRDAAARIEDAAFLQRHRRDWILRLGDAPAFLDLRADYLLALDAAGRITGHNRRAQQLFAPPGTAAGAVRCTGRPDLLFLRVSAPPAVSPARRPAETPRSATLPAPLAALSGGDPALDRLVERAARLVDSPVSLLITGETGSGKEFLAKALHRSSVRRDGPFVAVNCAAIPESLIESELFGHLPGSFSGAGPKGKRGLIQEADGGTLFLDEIGDMPRALQARLLRVLAEREVLPIGATRPQPVRLRVIAATHCPLETMVREGRFRDDLYYRLNGAHFALPPLRERRDLEALVARLLADDGAGTVLADDARAALLAHDWPGNLRELRNVVDYARSVCLGGVIRLADLPERLQGPGGRRAALAALSSAAPVAAVEHDAARQLRERLAAARWNVSAVAREMGVARMTLYRRMRRFGIVSPLDAAESSAE